MLAQVEESFAGLPLWRSVYRAGEPVGVAALADLAARAVRRRPTRSPYRTGAGPVRVLPAPRAVPCCASRCRSSTRDDVDLARNGDELVVTVGSYRRLLTLPAGLARLRVAGARVADGVLRVRFGEGAPASGSSRQHSQQDPSSTANSPTSPDQHRKDHA